MLSVGVVMAGLVPVMVLDGPYCITPAGGIVEVGVLVNVVNSVILNAGNGKKSVKARFE